MLSWTSMPAGVALSPRIVKLAGTVILELTVLGVSDPGMPVGAVMGLGVSAEV